MTYPVTITYPPSKIPARFCFEKLPIGAFFESNRACDRHRLFYKINPFNLGGALAFDLQGSTLVPEFQPAVFFGSHVEYTLAPDGIEVTLRGTSPSHKTPRLNCE